jgi:hypothetical protein
MTRRHGVKHKYSGWVVFHGQGTFIDWQLGTRAGFDAAAPSGTRKDELICRRPGVAPLSDWSRHVAPHGQRTRVDDGQSEAARFARLSNTDKLGVALRTTASAVGPEMGGKLQELVSPTNLAIMAGALAIWVGAHATPIGWVVDIGMVGLGVVALGAEAVSVMRELHAFAMGVIRAKSEADLMAAGRHLAKAIAIVGVDVVVAILLKKAVVKVREPGPAAGEAAGGPKLFGKYDPQDAAKSLPAERAAAGGGGVVDEAAAFSRISPGGGLQAHESAGGHLLSKHVGKSESDLMNRLANEPKISGSSSFYNRATAEDAVSRIIDANQGKIAEWLNGPGGRLRLDHSLTKPVGVSVVRGTEGAIDVRSGRVILIKDSSMQTGYKISTGFPTQP